VVVASFLLASLRIEYSSSWAADLQFWTPIVSCIALLVALAIHHLEHARSRVPSGVLLFYWLFFITVHGIQLRQSVSLQDYKFRAPRLIVLSIIEGFGIVVFALEWLVPKKRSAYSALDDDDQYECPTESATIFSILTFGWMTPMMKRGYTKFLTEDDLWDLREKDGTTYTERKFAKAWERQLNRKKPNLWLALFEAFGAPFGIGALFKVVQDILAFVQPQLLRMLIAFVASYNTGAPKPVIQGLAIAALMFLTSAVQTLALHQYFMHAFETGMRIKSALTAAIYRKSIRLSNEGRESKSTGDIVNLQAVDTQRLQGKTSLSQLREAPLTSNRQISHSMANRSGQLLSRLRFAWSRFTSCWGRACLLELVPC
jgi:ATP-binding cassette subfamily C (CFTR/MRP) protein 1